MMSPLAKVVRIGELEFTFEHGSRYLTIVKHTQVGHPNAAVLDIGEVDALRGFLGDVYSVLFELERDEREPVKEATGS